MSVNPRITFSQTYSMSIECRAQSNGVIYYEFPDFDRQVASFVSAIEMAREESSASQHVSSGIDGEQVVISYKLPHMLKHHQQWRFSIDEKSVGFENQSTFRTWKEAHEAGHIRILSVLNRKFPVDIGGRA